MIADSGAVMTTEPVALPVRADAPTPPLTPVSTVRVPAVTARVTSMASLPASMSVMEMPLMSSAVSSSTTRAPGTVLIGPSLTGVTSTGKLVPVVSEPPAPLAPWSSRDSWIMTMPLKSAAGRNSSPVGSARVAFRAAAGAVRVSVAVLLPPICPALTPLMTAPEATRVPGPMTVAVRTRSSAAPASTSLTLIPLSVRSVSSRVPRPPGAISRGASFTAVTVTAMVSVSVMAPPGPELPRSSVVMVIVSGPFTSVLGV